jgi:hypothetical protein
MKPSALSSDNEKICKLMVGNTGTNKNLVQRKKLMVMAFRFSIWKACSGRGMGLAVGKGTNMKKYFEEWLF